MKVSISMILVLIISIIIFVGTTGNELDGIDCGPVQNLRIIESDFHIGATWDMPLGDDCFRDSLVNIEMTIKGENYSRLLFNFRNTSIEFDKESCKTYRFGVQSIRSNGQPLHWAYTSKMSRIAGNGEVQYLEIINENTLSWMAPVNSDLCDITYIVNIDPKDFEATNKMVSITKTDINLIPCGNHSISVTTLLPQSSNWTGNPVTILRSGPIKKLSPRHDSTWPTTDGARVNWLEQEEDNACEIKGIQFGYVLTKLKDTQEPYFQGFDKSDDFWYQLDGMEENEEYSYGARWKLTEENFGEYSLIKNFLTKELTPPFIEPIKPEESITSDGDGLRIQWSQSYPILFIRKHVITVKDTGYNSKDYSELSVWRFENEPNDNTVIVSPVFPNHRYYINIQTIFDLNGYTSDSTYFKFERDFEHPERIIEVSGISNTNWTMRFSILDSRKNENN